MFSVGKGIATLIVLDAVSRGELALDAAIAVYWPEFGAAGKSAITLRQVLAHRAGVPAIREPLPRGAGLDAQRMARALEQQEPGWQPGEAHGYHVNTFGYLLNELLRRVSGDTIGRRHRAAAPSRARRGHVPRPARIRNSRVRQSSSSPSGTRTILQGSRICNSCTAMPMPSDRSLGCGHSQRQRMAAAEIPSANLHASARGVACVYAALMRGDLLPASLLLEAARDHAQGVDRVLDRPSRFGLGFQLTQPERAESPH